MSDPNNMPNWQLDDMRHNGPDEGARMAAERVLHDREFRASALYKPTEIPGGGGEVYAGAALPNDSVNLVSLIGDLLRFRSLVVLVPMVAAARWLRLWSTWPTATAFAFVAAILWVSPVARALTIKLVYFVIGTFFVLVLAGGVFYGKWPWG